MNGTKLNQNQNAFLGCDIIVNNYHGNRFIENNQKNVINNMPYAATEEEIFNILLNNYVTLNNGATSEIKRLAWSEKRALASIDYTVKKASINEQTVVVNDGN